MSHRSLVAAVVAALLVSCAPTTNPGPSIARGSTISVRTVDEITTKVQRPGDPFSARLGAPIRDSGVIVVPIGARVEGVVDNVRPRQRDDRPPQMTLRLTRLYLPDDTYVELHTTPLTREPDPPSGEVVVVRKETQLVFTLDREARIPRAR